MRRTRWLLLAAILAIVCVVGFTYWEQGRTLRNQAPAKPAALPGDLRSTAKKWKFAQTTKEGKDVEIAADDFRELKDSSRVDLRGVELKLHDPASSTHTLVTCAAAWVSTREGRFFSEGEVEITLDVPEQGPPKQMLVSIKSSGVSFDINTGRAETDRPSSFTFENGTGTATGAFYDPTLRELLLKQNAVLDWKPAGPRAKAMKIEAGSLQYREAVGEIWLTPWGRMTREKTIVEGTNPVIHLEKQKDGGQSIRKIDAIKAHGSDDYPRRKLKYSADELWVDFDDDGEIRKIIAQTNAQLTATSDTSVMDVSAFHVELDFNTSGEQSVLTDVSTSGNSVVTSKPLPAPGRQLPETHILRSEKLSMKMRPDGREIDNVTTHTPGTLEFLPNLPAQHYRKLDGNEMVIAYGPQNRVQSFRARGVRTRTEPNAEELKRKRPVSITASREMQAAFEPKTGRMTTIEQTGDFSYEEGDRRARAERATLDSITNVILLETGARVWDASGATSADRIRMDQRTDDFTAEGNVNSSRLPDKSQKKSTEILSGDEPLQAQAARMVSRNRNRSIHYEGNVVMWQAANRIQGETVDLDRDKRTLVANGRVITNLWEAQRGPGKDASKKPSSPVLTEVRASRLVYTEEGRLAHYTGGVELSRPRLNLKSRELRAWLSTGGEDSNLEKAFADGDVRIVMTSPERTRTGTAEHSEYFVADQKIVLNGGKPTLVDTRTGTSTGTELTYWANDDRLLVNGSPAQPAESRFRRKK